MIFRADCIKMIRTCESTGAVRARAHVIFRYMINPDLKFIREKEDLAEERIRL